MGFFSLFDVLIFIYSLKYETIVSKNGLSLGYSKRDTCSVCSHNPLCMLKNKVIFIVLGIFIFGLCTTTTAVQCTEEVSIDGKIASFGKA